MHNSKTGPSANDLPIYILTSGFHRPIAQQFTHTHVNSTEFHCLWHLKHSKVTIGCQLFETGSYTK